MNRTVVAVVLAGVVVVAIVAVLALSDRRDAPPVVAVPQAAAIPDDIAATAAATRVPERALRAYIGAAERLAADQPECRLAWNTLAGIGSVESMHGTFGGARIDAGGVASPRIIGLPLDGTSGTRAIRDTDDGMLDGDPTWDRAVGPMQFIPGTWHRWGSDADGDGRTDPNDIDDAALAAGRYLCDAGGDLGESAGWSEAVLTYNRSVLYAEGVARTATEYARS